MTSAGYLYGRQGLISVLRSGLFFENLVLLCLLMQDPSNPSPQIKLRGNVFMFEAMSIGFLPVMQHSGVYQRLQLSHRTEKI